MFFLPFSREYENNIQSLLIELSDFYDGHVNAKFYEQLIGKSLKDDSGIFTKKKQIYCAVGDDNQFFGFICLSYKRGNTVKIGPIMVEKKHRHKGIGSFLLDQVINKMQTDKIRKIYATTSSLNLAATNLMKKKLFKLEAELPDQYRNNSIEYVWGLFLDEHSVNVANNFSLVTDNTLNSVNLLIAEFDENTDGAFLNKGASLMSNWHDDINDEYIDQLKSALVKEFDHETRGIKILVSRNSKNLTNGLAVLAPKRGGAVKIYPLFGQRQALYELIKKTQLLLGMHKYRKLYTFAIPSDNALIETLKNAGFTERGRLCSPYKKGCDLFVFDRLLTI